jgi:hypothetical protein
MAAFSKLHQDLATANRHIAESQASIAQQAKVVSELDADGYDPTNARNLLRLLQRNLEVMNTHPSRSCTSCRAVKTSNLRPAARQPQPGGPGPIRISDASRICTTRPGACRIGGE